MDIFKNVQNAFLKNKPRKFELLEKPFIHIKLSIASAHQYFVGYGPAAPWSASGFAPASLAWAFSRDRYRGAHKLHIQYFPHDWFFSFQNVPF
jgi:hypothetical protein